MRSEAQKKAQIKYNSSHVNMRLPRELHAIVKAKAQRLNLTIIEFLKEVIKE